MTSTITNHRMRQSCKLVNLLSVPLHPQIWKSSFCAVAFRVTTSAPRRKPAWRVRFWLQRSKFYFTIRCDCCACLVVIGAGNHLNNLCRSVGISVCCRGWAKNQAEYEGMINNNSKLHSTDLIHRNNDVHTLASPSSSLLSSSPLILVARLEAGLFFVLTWLGCRLWNLLAARHLAPAAEWALRYAKCEKK